MRKFTVLFLLVTTLLAIAPVEYVHATPVAKPTAFFLMQEGEDFPSILPVGTKEDNRGNIHSLYYYIEPDLDNDGERFMVLYYSVVTKNGESFLYQLDKHPFSLTLYAIFSQQLFVEYDNGTISGMFIKPSDFGTKLKLFSWNSGLKLKTIPLPANLTVTGDIIGPKRDFDSNIIYYLPAVNLSGNYLIQLEFSPEGRLKTSTSFPFPTFQVGLSPNVTTTIFDIAYANDTRYFLAGIQESPSYDSLALIREDSLNNYSRAGIVNWINVKPSSSIGFLRNILMNAFLPHLVSTTSGKLFSFLSNFDNDFNMLVQWKDAGAVDLFSNVEPNPFFLTFFPSIYAVEDSLVLYFLGLQYAQDAISFSIDRFDYQPSSRSLVKTKFIENSLSSDLFLYVADPEVKYIVGIATRYSTPKSTLNQFGILNKTVGEVFLFSESSLPDVQPEFINLTLKDDLISREEGDPLFVLIPVILFLTLGLSIISFYQWRKKRLQMPEELISLQKTKKEIMDKKSFLQLSLIQFHVSFIFLKTNRGRILRSILVLVLPALLLMSIFVGIISHQNNLMQTFEAQNPLNNPEEISLTSSLASDFKWQNIWYWDEYQNSSLSELDLILSGQLSKISMKNYGVQALGTNMASTTIFPLFEKKEFKFEINNETVQFNFPDPHEFAIVSRTWSEFLESQLVRGRLPTAPNEVLVQEAWYTPKNRFTPDAPYGVLWDLDSELNLYASELDLFLNTSLPKLNQSIKVVGVIRKVENLPFAEIESWATKLNTTTPGLRIIDSVPFVALPQYMSAFLNNYSRLSIRPTSYVHVRYNVFDLQRQEIPSLIKNLREMGNTTLQITGFTWIGNFSDSRISNFLETYFDASRDIQLEGFVLTVPVLALTLLLTYEAIGMGRTSVQQEIIRFRREGLRTEKIIFLLFQERILSAGVATFGAALVVSPTTRFLLLLTDYFKIGTGYTPPVDAFTIPPVAFATFFALSLVGVLQSLNTLFSKEDWRYTRMLSGVQRDLVVVIFGLILVVASNLFSTFLEDQLKVSGGEINAGMELILLSIQLISVVFATIGGLIVVSKVLNRVFALLGYFGWRSVKRKEGLIFKGFQMHIGLYGKLLVVFLIGFFLIVPMLTIPLTIQNTYRTKAYYSFGTDIKVDHWERVESDRQKQVYALDGIKSTSEFFYGTIPFANGVDITVFAYNKSTFLDTTVIPDQFIDNFQVNWDLVRNLPKNSFLTNQKFVDRNSLDIGERIPLQFSHSSKILLLELKGIYNEFPIFKSELSRIESKEETPLQMVMTLETLKEIQNQYLYRSTEASADVADFLDQRTLILRAQRYEDIDGIGEQIRSLSGARAQLITYEVNKLNHPFFRIFEFLTHTSIIVSGLAPVLSTVILSKTLFERRKEELEVYYRMGTPSSFFVKQLSIELIFSTLLPSLLAIPLGYWWTSNYGADMFGQKNSLLYWNYNQLTITIWVVVISLLSLFVWIWQIKNAVKKHLEEVRL